MNTNPSLSQKLEALLFAEGGELSFSIASNILGVTEEEVKETANIFVRAFEKDRGVVCIISETDISLRVAPVCSEFINEYKKKLFSEEVGPAALEILAILLYRGPSTQAEIESIRGVHSSYSLRSLRARGLVERKMEGSKSLYTVTSEALAHLGVTSELDIPDREMYRNKIRSFEENANSK